jgi:hypothetical protein
MFCCFVATQKSQQTEMQDNGLTEVIPVLYKPVKGENKDSLTIAKFKTYYDELMSFAYNEDFNQYGFALPRYKDWYNKVSVLDNHDELAMLFNLHNEGLRIYASQFIGNKNKDFIKSYQIRYNAAFKAKYVIKEKELSLDDLTDYKLIGEWVATNKSLSNLVLNIKIVEKDNKYYDIQYVNGDFGNIKQLEKQGNKYVEIGDYNAEYYVIKNNSLRMCNLDGEYTKDYDVVKIG